MRCGRSSAFDIRKTARIGPVVAVLDFAISDSGGDGVPAGVTRHRQVTTWRVGDRNRGLAAAEADHLVHEISTLPA
jgi:hypothetical protein